MTQNDSDRRTFLKTSTAAAAGAALTSTIAKTAHAAGSDTIRFVLIGCGGRGTGAIKNSLALHQENLYCGWWLPM